jgi:hypothetical protein
LLLDLTNDRLVENVFYNIFRDNGVQSH